MRLSERLNKDNFNKEDRKKKTSMDFYMEEEETLMYMPAKLQGYINEGQGKFSGFGDVGLNNALNIYDKQAVFKTWEG